MDANGATIWAAVRLQSAASPSQKNTIAVVKKRHSTKRKLVEKILDSRKKCVTFLVVWSEQTPHPGLGRGPEDQEEPHYWLTP